MRGSQLESEAQEDVAFDVCFAPTIVVPPRSFVSRKHSFSWRAALTSGRGIPWSSAATATVRNTPT